MVNQTEALDRLTKERDYEDKLVSDLTKYFLVCLDDIKDLTEEEKTKINSYLKRIIEDSQNHSFEFSQLIQTVTENGEDNY